MKFFVAFAAIVAVAVANPLTKPVGSVDAELVSIIEAINSPNTDPATAHLLAQMLQDLIAASLPVEVDPVVIGTQPIAVLPEIIDFPQPQPDGGAVTAPVQPSPVVVGPLVPGAPAPLVQLIVNINQGADSAVVPVAPGVAPTPVNVVDEAENIDPVQVVEVPVDPVNVVDIVPVVVEPVVVGTPTFPAPAVNLPGQLN